MKKENKGGRKSNELDYEAKMNRAFEMMLYEKMGYTEFKLKGAKEFGITERAAENMWADVRARIKERFTLEQEAILDDQLSRSHDLLNRARLANNRRVESEVLRDLSKLYGLDIKKVDVTSGGQPININIKLTE